MKKYVVDTHALVWQLCSPSHLGQSAQIAFTQADNDEAKIHTRGKVSAAKPLSLATNSTASRSFYSPCSGCHHRSRLTILVARFTTSCELTP